MKVERTNIIIRLEESIVQVGENLKTKWEDFRLKIIAPSSAYASPMQSIGWAKMIKVPKNGVIKLQLLPSSLYGDRAVGREKYYKVELYHKHQSLPLETWYWNVPQRYRKRVRVISYYAPSVELPSDFFEIIECSCDDYQIVGNKLILSGAEDGTPVTVEYRPGANLNDITTYRYGSVSRD